MFVIIVATILVVHFNTSTWALTPPEVSVSVDGSRGPHHQKYLLLIQHNNNAETLY